MFFSQYFRFPLWVSFHHCSLLIHSSTTHAVLCFSPSTSGFPCQYHSTIAPYSFIHPPPTPYYVFLPVLQFSPVSIIPPLLHTHSFIHHPRCIMFFSSTSVFPCQYHSTITPYSFIHPPPTLYNVYLPVLQFSPVSIIPPLPHTHSSTTHTVYCFSPSTSGFPCQYHSTIAPYSFIHPPPMPYYVFLQVLQFSPVSMIPPLLHTHSSITHAV